jgi:hypothetical protein
MSRVQPAIVCLIALVGTGPPVPAGAGALCLGSTAHGRNTAVAAPDPLTPAVVLQTSPSGRDTLFETLEKDLAETDSDWGATPGDRWGRPDHARCEEFRHSNFAEFDEDPRFASWSFSCERRDLGGETSWKFYALPEDDDAPALRLAHRHRRIRVASSDAANLREHLWNRLQRLLGTGERPNWATAPRESSRLLAEKPGEWNANWSDVRQYSRQDAGRDYQLVAYVETPPAGGPITIGLLARDRRLLRWVEDWRRTESSRGIDAVVTEELVAALGNRFPLLGSLLLDRERTLQSRRHEVGRAIVEVLSAARDVPFGDRAPFLLAAHVVGSGWISGGFPEPARTIPTEPPYIVPLQDFFTPSHAGVLDRYDVRVRGTRDGCCLLMTEHLLTRIIHEYPFTKWGDLATVYLLGQGWSTGDYCDGGNDQFREVIVRGETFLRELHDARFTPTVHFLIGLAYETWWSLSQASADAELVNRTEYLEGANDARLKAIDHFARVLAIAPSSSQALYARYHLPRLQLGLDTGQRAYYCIYP